MMGGVEAPPIRPPVLDVDPYQALQDADQLRLIALLSQIYGWLAFVLSGFFLLYIIFAITVTSQPGFFGSPNSAPPFFFRTFILVFGLIGLGLGWLNAGLSLYAGKCLRERRNWNWVMVASCLHCLNMPLGTALGVFTIIVINRPSVRAQFVVPLKA